MLYLSWINQLTFWLIDSTQTRSHHTLHWLWTVGSYRPHASKNQRVSSEKGWFYVVSSTEQALQQHSIQIIIHDFHCTSRKQNWCWKELRFVQFLPSRHDGTNGYRRAGFFAGRPGQADLLWECILFGVFWPKYSDMRRSWIFISKDADLDHQPMWK